MKKVIFDKNQQELFTYVKKPNLGVDYIRRRSLSKVHEKDLLLKCFKSIKEKEAKEKIDERLIENLDEKIKFILENKQ